MAGEIDVTSGDQDDLDLISAIWILACNDENHLITYDGIKIRLGLDSNFDVRGLVSTRRELFRFGGNQAEIDDWKQQMKGGQALPLTIAGLQGADRLAAIEAFGVDDVFRSQFRARRRAGPSELSVLNWGLDHIDRLRKAKAARKDATAKEWQMWLALGLGVANIVVSLLKR